jgi:hypothetical protein
MPPRRLALVLALTAAGCARRAPLPVVAAAPEDPVIEASRAWANRDQPGELERCIEALTRAPDSPARWVERARALELRARRAPTPEARLEAYGRALEAAEAALLAAGGPLAEALRSGSLIEDVVQQAAPSDLPALYWYATSLSGYALTRGLPGTVRFRRRVEALYGLVLSRDEAYEEAGAHRGLGSYYARAPAAAGGDLALAREHFERALELAPGSADNRLAYAEDYAVAVPDRDLFTRLLEEAAAARGGADPAGTELARGRARALLARAAQLF